LLRVATVLDLRQPTSDHRVMGMSRAFWIVAALVALFVLASLFTMFGHGTGSGGSTTFGP